MTASRLESRAWLAWGACAMIPLLVARNPFVVAVILVSVLAVRVVWMGRARQGWGWIVRFAALFMVVGVIFNALTVHSGNQVLYTIPDRIPLFGGPITLNAIAYGVASGLAILTLVLVGTTVAANLVWADLMRSLPARFAPLAVAGSVAWSFLPGASQAFQDIRESQAARGHRIRGIRDLLPLVVPLLGGGLERAIAMSEALESRGFGHSGGATVAVSPVSRYALVGALGSGMLLAYAFAVGQAQVALSGLVLTIALFLVAVGTGRSQVAVTTRYRVSSWRSPDWIVTIAGVVALVAFLWRQRVIPDAAIFNPYPNLEWPLVDLPMLLGLAVLMVPAMIVPAPTENR